MRTDLLENGRLGEFESTALGVGTARLGAFWQKRGIPEGTAALSQALDLGIGLVDTADVYARGISERIVGRVVRTRPSTVVMTKVGLLKTPSVWPPRPSAESTVRGSPVCALPDGRILVLPRNTFARRPIGA